MAGSSARTDNGRAFRMPRRMSTRRTYNQAMIPRPQTAEAAPYYFNYIDQGTGDDPLGALENQLEEALFSAIAEEKSLHRYAPDKWSIRQVLNHVTDTERVAVQRYFFGDRREECLFQLILQRAKWIVAGHLVDVIEIVGRGFGGLWAGDHGLIIGSSGAHPSRHSEGGCRTAGHPSSTLDSYCQSSWP